MPSAAGWEILQFMTQKKKYLFRSMTKAGTTATRGGQLLMFTPRLNYMTNYYWTSILWPTVSTTCSFNIFFYSNTLSRHPWTNTELPTLSRVTWGRVSDVRPEPKLICGQWSMWWPPCGISQKKSEERNAVVLSALLYLKDSFS